MSARKEIPPQIKTLSPQEEEAKAIALAEKLGLAYVDLLSFRINAELFRSVPVEWMLRYEFVPEARTDRSMTIIAADPSDVVRFDELELLIGLPLKRKVGSRAAIAEILQKSESSQRVLDEATEDFRLQLVSENEEGEETLTIDSITQDSSPIIKLVDSILFNAIQRRASDIHIETQERDRRHQVPDRRRALPGHGSDRQEAPRHHHFAHQGHVRARHRRKAHSAGRPVQAPRPGPDDRFPRLDHAHGPRRRRGHPNPRQGVRQRRSSASSRSTSSGSTKKRSGSCASSSASRMAWFSSPDRRARGKTTTLYACLSEIQSVEDKIVTIEDPVEYQLKGITQIPVNEKKGLTFARGLRSILRHDPDKIMVGEIRDDETAQIAVQSALTGHLVFTTVHANNVVDVIGRFLNMKVDLYNFVSALNCVLAQRLVRRLCPHCKESVTYSRDTLLESGLLPNQTDGKVFYEGRGCLECNGTGFRGRMAIAELLDLSDRIRGPDPGEAARFGDQERRQRAGNDLPARLGHSQSVLGRHDAQGNQQGDVCRLAPSRPSCPPTRSPCPTTERPSFAFPGTSGPLSKSSAISTTRRAPGRSGFSALPSSATTPFAPPRRRRNAPSGRAVRRTCVTIPDAWARTLTLDFDVLPSGRRERSDMVNWKIKKLLPGRVEDLEIVFSEIPKTGEGIRLLVSAAPRDTIRSIESAFGAVGIRVGLLSTSTLAFFNGFDDRLSRSAGGDYLLLHRSGRTSSLLIARNGHPLFYRQKAATEEGTDDAQELRLSLSYYAETLGGAETPALYLWDEPTSAGHEGSESLEPMRMRPVNAALLLADSSLDLHSAAHPEVLAAAAATLEND